MLFSWFPIKNPHSLLSHLKWNPKSTRWPPGPPTLLPCPSLFSILVLRLQHTHLFSVAKNHQAYSHLRAFALAVHFCLECSSSRYFHGQPLLVFQISAQISAESSTRHSLAGIIPQSLSITSSFYFLLSTFYYLLLYFWSIENIDWTSTHCEHSSKHCGKQWWNDKAFLLKELTFQWSKPDKSLISTWCFSGLFNF